MRQPFARLANDRRRRRVYFQTIMAAARTFNAAEWVDRDVSNLGCRSIRTAPHFAIENNSATHAGPECQANNCAVAPSRTLPHLPDRSGVCIVLQDHRAPKFAFQNGGQRKAIKARNVWS